MTVVTREALEALLEVARGLTVTDKQIEMIRETLPEEVFARFHALVVHRNATTFAPRMEEAIENAPRLPDAIDHYEIALGREQARFRRAKSALPKLIEKSLALDVRIGQANDAIENAKAIMAAKYEALTAEEKLWLAPGSQKEGWPPLVGDKAPPHALFPGEELPRAYALRIICEELLRDLK